MINVSNEFKTRTKKIKQQSIKLGIVDGELTVKDIHFMTVEKFNALPVWMLRARKKVIAKELKYSFEGSLFKTIMKQIEITVKNAGEIKDKNVNFQYGIYVNNDFEYIDLGDYYIKDVEDDKGKKELVVTGYDKMINFMKTFKQSDLQLTYPCKMSKLVQRMSEICGVELYSMDFFNADLLVDEDYFTAQELTYRDVLEKVAQSTLTTIFIKDNKLYLHKLSNSPVEKLDASYLTGLTIKEKFGPVNALVLGRGDVEDNVEAKDDTNIAQNGRCEIRFDENEFIEYKREQVIDEMFEQIKGLEYYAFEGSDVGVMWLEPCDLIEVEDTENNTYQTIYLKANITINTGIRSDIEADVPEETNTEYKVTTKEEKKTLKVERLAKKNEGLIKDLIKETSDNGEKLTEVEQTVDRIKETVSSVETKVEEVESTANTANTNATQAQNTANEAKETAEITTKKVTEVEKTVDGISQNVEKVETTLKADYSTTEETNSKIEQEAGKITNSVTEKIENIQVGGTNLVPNSAPYNLEGYGNYGTIKKELIDEKTSPSGKALKITAKTAGSFGIYIKPTKDIEIGKQYSYSVWIKANRAMKLSVGHEKGGTTYFDVTTQWKKYTYTYEAKNTSEYSSFLVNTKTAQIGDIIYIHSIKLEEGNKVTAWSPAPEDDVKGFEFGTKIEQNAKNVQVAWNNESQNIRIENDGGNSTMGFYDNDAKFAEMGVNNVDNNKYISFAVPCGYNKRIADGMAWGVQTPDGKFHPILFIKNFEMGNEQSDATYGQLELSNCDLVIGGNYELGSGGAIVVGNITMAGDPLGGLSFTDDMGKYLFTINKGDGSALTPYDTIKILNNIEFYRNQQGSNSFRVGPEGKCCLLTDNGDLIAERVYIGTGPSVSVNIHGEVYVYDGSLTITDGNIYANNISSDVRLKEDIKNVDIKALDVIRKIRHKQFKMKTDEKHYNIGYIAQELEKIDENFVLKRKTGENEKLEECQYYINELPIIATATKAIQEQQEIIENQNNLIQDLIKRVEKLEKGEQNGT